MEPNVTTLNAAISACGKGTAGKEIVQLSQVMVQSSVEYHANLVNCGSSNLGLGRCEGLLMQFCIRLIL